MRILNNIGIFLIFKEIYKLLLHVEYRTSTKLFSSKLDLDSLPLDRELLND